jgi:hypothetical protein
MNGTLFLRTSIVLLILGIAMGMHMGMTQNFTFAPVHAHINLVGGVLMFLAGLFYNSRPDIPPRWVSVHYVLHLLGAVLLPIGIYASISGKPWAVNLFRRVPVGTEGRAS